MDGYEYSHCICMVCYKHWNHEGHEIESADNTKAASTTTTIYTGGKTGGVLT